MKGSSVPEGVDFLALVWELEDTCENDSDERIPNLGKKASPCLEGTGTLLSLLDRMASCWWGCQGGKHQIEYLLGRVSTNARGALRLLRFGFYDESLTLSRTIGESANLLNLLALDGQALDKWKASHGENNPSCFRPVEVRRRIEEIQGRVLIDRDRYHMLSNNVVHPHSKTKPQTFNPLRIPSAGALVQDEGILICLNELALPLGVATAFGVRLLDIEKDIKKRVVSCAGDLIRQIGGVTIDNRPPSIFDEVRSEAPTP